MIDLGKVRPGRTLRIPFSSYNKTDGSSITMTNFAAADVLIYKDGGTTERASTAGFTATTDFDSKTGKHLAIIDLADNTTAGFFTAGSEYLVAIDAVTVDGVTTGGWIARFTIGYEGSLFDTTIASLSSQTSFTLTDGPAEDDALNNLVVFIHDIASAVQFGRAVIADYTGSTKTVTLQAGTTFTAAAGDNISIMPQGSLNAVDGDQTDWNALTTNSYQAKVWMQDDNANTNDRYIATWYKNGVQVTSGITSPTIQVIAAATGSDLVASTSMTQIGSTGAYRYSEGTNRITDGAAYLIVVTATIDGATRTWYQPMGRDSA